MSIPFLDHLLEALLSRFSAEIALNGLSIVPAIIKSEYSENQLIGRKRSHEEVETSNDNAESLQMKEDRQSCETVQSPCIKLKNKVKFQRLDKKWKNDFENFCCQYAGHLPDISKISHEVDNRESLWTNTPDDLLPDTIAETIKVTNSISFPNISTALWILAVLPVTSCTCERSASAIRLV